MDSSGNVYIADTNNDAVRKVSASTNIITDAGIGSGGYTGDGGPAVAAQLFAPMGVALDSASNLYIADTYNYAVRAVGAGPITPLIVWQPPLPITYGTALSSTQLNATTAVAGSFTYNPVSGTVLAPGQQLLGATFSPTDTSDYTSVYASMPLTVSQATPVITWANPAAVPEGTALSSTQLNATASVAGSFAYFPAAGTVFTETGPQLLTVVFTPTNTTDYVVTSASVSLQVQTGTHHQDSGTVELLINTGSGFNVSSPVASTTYSAGATPSSVAAGLANGIVGTPPFTLSAANDQLTIVSTATGVAANYPYEIETTAWDTADFPGEPSFANPPITGALDGGAASTTSGQAPQTIYSFGGQKGT